MSINGSDTSSHIRQFGLYRTIDAKTEEFLRLSKKRQIKQGCACAAISTVITVAVVIIVLLVYEYVIAVETTVVQIKGIKYKTKYNIKESPMADRLDGNYFGVDQDYYEKIPLLINDLQESYIDIPEPRIRLLRKERKSIINRFRTRTSSTANKFVRRTSPRPFLYEYRSPYPMPFSKATTNPFQWLEQYRNSQRLKNLHDVVKYLEKTLNAKFSDINLPSTEHISFSELYIPVGNDNIKSDELSQNIEKNNLNENHYTDPLFIFKPNSPGEINLLADGLRFAPTLVSSQEKNVNKDNTEERDKQNCVNNGCLQHNRNRDNNYFIPNSERIRTIPFPALNNKPKTFSHSPNHYSNLHLQPRPQESKNDYKIDFDKVYITTSRPFLFQFRRKSTLPVRRTLYKNKNSRFLDVNKKFQYSSSFTYHKNNTDLSDDNYEISNSNNRTDVKQLYPSAYEANISNLKQETTIAYTTETNIPAINLPRIEDYHVGSSGIIPIETSSTQAYPIFTPETSPRDIFILNQEQGTTNPPEIIKFSPEDAKIPDQYLNLGVGIANGDTVTESDGMWQTNDRTGLNDDGKEAKMLIIKLRNMFETTTGSSDSEATELLSTPDQDEYVGTTEEEIESTTNTYVPQINGHYRNVKNKTLMLLQENSEKYRKKRLENLLSIRNSTYVPMYVDIVRHRNASVINSDYD